MRALWLFAFALSACSGSDATMPDAGTDCTTRECAEAAIDCGDRVHDGDVSVSDPTDLVAIGDVTRVTGNVSITTNGSDVVASQEVALRCIDGSLDIANTSLTSLQGLSNLQRVGGDLELFNNLSLEDVDGLAALTLVDGNVRYHFDGGSLDSQDDIPLTELTFESVIDVAGDLILAGRPDPNGDAFRALVTVGGNVASGQPGLNTLESVEGDLQLTDGAAAGPSYVSLRTVEGSVDVRYDTLEIPDLDALESVGGDIRFATSALEAVSGFGSLETVAGGINLTNVEGLETIDGFPELVSVGSSGTVSGLSIDGRYGTVTEISGFQKLERVTGSLTIADTNATEITGLSSLREVNGRISVSGNANLTSLSSFTSLERVGADEELTGPHAMSIVNNASLTDLGGLSGLVNVYADIVIQANDQLVSLPGNAGGLDNLETLNGILEIHENPQLTDLGRLPSAVTVYGLSIRDNTSLPDCELYEFLTALELRDVGLEDVSVEPHEAGSCTN